MSLLPRIMQFRDDALCLPLGPAVQRDDRKHMLDGCSPEWVFENIPHYIDITEADCRQIKGSAQDSRKAEKVGGTRPSPVAAPPTSTEKPPKFKAGDRVQLTEDPVLSPDHRGRRGTVYAIPGRQLYEGCHFVALDGEGKTGRMFSERYLIELIPSEPKEADGWVPYKQGNEVPDERLAFAIRWSDGTERNYTGKNLRVCMRTWDGNSWVKVRAYRLVK